MLQSIPACKRASRAISSRSSIILLYLPLHLRTCLLSYIYCSSVTEVDLISFNFKGQCKHWTLIVALVLHHKQRFSHHHVVVQMGMKQIDALQLCLNDELKYLTGRLCSMSACQEAIFSFD